MKGFGTGTYKTIIPVLIVACCLVYFESCRKDNLIKTDNLLQFPQQLSEHAIFRGNPSDLVPGDGFFLYEIPTQLFSDYAEKQRLLKLPPGTRMTAQNNGLPAFPDGTLLVKTFYYFNDKRNPAAGKKIIETRLLLKWDSKWNVATYLWNEAQTEAFLVTSGLNKTVNWIDGNGHAKVISYHVPNMNECTTCHNDGGNIIPIGPKIRNLNTDVIRNNTTINQLLYFQNAGVMDSTNNSGFLHTAAAYDTNAALADRGRAYLDINCAHCHNQSGKAADSKLFMDYEIPLAQSGIKDKDNSIKNLMGEGQMPKIGTTLVDEEGFALIKQYIESL